MENTSDKYNSIIEEFGICVLIPTYNNAVTLKEVLDRILNFTDRVIILNDGSTDSTKEILKPYENQLTVIHFEKNKGKGKALRAGFKKSIELGYRHAISIDSDGQHFPEDLPLFFEEIKKNPDSLIMGARDMSMEEVPGKSSFGNKFSNFWYYVETGIKLPDTQTGYRCYPLNTVKRIKLFTSKFELEIEVIVKLAWRNVNVISIPVKVRYDFEERVSHFRPFKDFFRISVLNTYLFTLTLLFYLPKRFLNKFSRKNILNTIKQEWEIDKGNDIKRSLSVGVGVMMGIFPIWGFQMLVAVLIATALKLNKIIVLAASNISIPPFIPLIVYLSYLMGSVFVENEYTIASMDEITLDMIHFHFKQYFIGASVLSIVAGAGAFLLTYILMKIKRIGRSS